jgi:iron complex transport system substrate-binding protein
MLCVLALQATACGQRPEPTGATVEVYPVTVTDAEGEETSLDASPQRILAVSDSMARTLRALGIPSSRITVGNGSGGSVDLTAAWATSREPTPDRSSGPTYIGADRSIDDVKSSLLDLSLLVGRPLRARALVEEIDRRVEAVRGRFGRGRPVRVFLDTGTFNTIESPGLVDDIIRTAGGRNVAGAATENQQPDPRELRRLRPRYYLATSSSGTTLARLRADPKTRHLPAVEAGRFGIVPDVELEPGPRVGDGVVTIARIVHSDAPR